jgi:hypothetical protein
MPFGWLGIDEKIIQGDSNMTGTDLCVNKPQSVPVIFEPPCIMFNDISCGQAFENGSSKLGKRSRSAEELGKSSQCRFNKSFLHLLLLETIFAAIQCTIYTIF